MRRTHRLGLMLGATLLAFSACDDDETGPDTETFVAAMTGAAERPTPVTTTATGTATFTVNGNNLDFVITANNIRNVTAAHIHGPAPVDSAAGIIVGLFSANPPTGLINGTLASGTITPEMVAASTSSINTMIALLDLIRAGRAYVNVHTNDGVAPTNTGPGDFPGGEIRGQIRTN